MKRAVSRKNLWDRTPSWLRSSVGRAVGVMPPHWVLGRAFRNQRRQALDAQWWSADRARQYQLQRVREILTFAYEKAPFYRRAFDRAGFHPEVMKTLDVIRSIPTIDRQTVAENLEGMCTRDVKETDVDFASTGGVSGAPLHFYLDASRSAVEYAYLTASWARAGYKLGMPMATLRGRAVPVNRMGLHHEYDPILRHHYYSSFHMSDEDMGRYLEHIAGIGPCFLHVYPSTASTLARFLRRSGVKTPQNIRGIIAESEIVYPEQRRMLEEVFGCDLFSCYGQSEKVVLATGCEESDDYHVWPTYGYFELLDAEGKVVATPGERGEIVGTGFISTVMPFIRYRTGDWATYVGDRCETCGREHIIIRDIRGHRIQEVLIAADGSEIPWTALNMHDDTFINVQRFQFMQEIPGRATLRIIPANGLDGTEVERILDRLGKKLDGRLALAIEMVDAIDLPSRGKMVYVDQRISQTKA